jgi:hypothetical protein
LRFRFLFCHINVRKNADIFWMHQIKRTDVDVKSKR